MTENKPKLRECIFKRIEDEQVCPRSRMFFHSRECFVWTLWFLSIVVGALAVAVSLFVMTHRQYALYEATHDNYLTYFVEVLPYLWLIVFGSMAFFAVYNLKHTKRGYRYPVSYILLSSVILSFAGGSALQFFGLGYTFDYILGERMHLYASQAKIERQLWQAPNDGRLLGRQVGSTIAPTSSVIFLDTTGNRWRLEVFELLPEDIALLASQRQVRIVGKVATTSSGLFHACGVFPWMLDRNFTMADMNRQRQEFVRKAYDQMHQADERIRLLEAETFADNEPRTMPICAELAVMHRLSDAYQD